MGTPSSARRRARAIALAALALLPFGAGAGERRRSPAPRGYYAVQPESGSLSRVVVLCYHDIAEGTDVPDLTVSTETLRAHVRALKAAGWTFLSLSETLERLERGARLPDRVAVLTFDDGYESFLTRALPVLRDEGVPATLAIITSFVDDPPPDVVPLLSWSQIREAEASGLVEIASHSHDLHRWIPSNPHRDTAPSVATRRYLLDEARYEGREEYRERIRRDLVAAREALQENLGHGTDVHVWPFGAHNEMARSIAAEAGFRWTLALGGRFVQPEDVRAGTLPRVMVTRTTPILDGDLAWLERARTPIRAIQADIDPLWDENPERFHRNVDDLVARVREAGATHVILQALPDPKGDGMFRQAWFANHQIPIKADVWSAVAAKLHHAGVQVWARAPVLNLSWLWKRHPEWRIPRDRRIQATHDPWYYRVSPDVPEARAAALDFYADLAVYLPLDGVLFDDDAYMLPNEELRRSGITEPRLKSDAVREMIDEIVRTVRAWRPYAEFGRNLYAPVAEQPGVHTLFAQDLEQSMRDHDLTFVMAYAHMEGHGDEAPRWIKRLVRKTLERWKGEGPAPVVFKLQSYDWSGERWLEDGELRTQSLAALDAGASHLGVYPAPRGAFGFAGPLGPQAAAVAPSGPVPLAAPAD